MKKVLVLIAILLPLLVFAEEEVVGYLGISGKTLSKAMKTALDLEYGVLVEKVFENSPADWANIEIGDVILKIDDKEMENFFALKNIIQENPGRKVEINISRSGKKISKTIELGQKEKKRLNLDIELPDMYELKEFFSRGAEELRDELDHLKEMVEGLKDEVEELKKQIK
jgi:C-terminal processing protease CtpA/Prc